MSKPLTWDALLARAIARELDDRLTGRRAHALRLDAGARALLLGTAAGTLVWRLHPAEGGLVIVEVRSEGNVSLPGGARIAGVEAPSDERTVVLTIATPDHTWGRLVIELAGNARNALLVSRDDRILAVLNERRTVARTVAAGVPYARPPVPRRAGRDGILSPGEWTGLLDGAATPDELRARLLATIAWTSPLNARFVLGEGTGPQDPEAMRQRWAMLADPASWRPCVLSGAQPYIHAMGDAEARSAASLLDAFAAVTSAQVAAAGEDRRDAALLVLERRRERALRRAERLHAEADGAQAEARTLRHRADLLLAQLHRVKRGASEVQLDDWHGGTVTVALDPALDAARNATALYEAAKKRERAAVRLPRLIAKAEQEAVRLETMIRDVAAGRIAPDPAQPERPAPRTGRARPGPALPYRGFRTSGGLEVRVGRGARANDDLTFHHSSPNDVWMHARDVAGAHVVLRWPDAASNPPQRDLVEAAVLAAVHSRARTSGTVPVDWTRRKYVRKPRRSPPGRVSIERARTLFVEPSESLVERLRVEAE